MVTSSYFPTESRAGDSAPGQSSIRNQLTNSLYLMDISVRKAIHENLCRGKWEAALGLCS
jgi:hypothetical protein